jgi:hypothetical protein
MSAGTVENVDIGPMSADQKEAEVAVVAVMAADALLPEETEETVAEGIPMNMKEDTAPDLPDATTTEHLVTATTVETEWTVVTILEKIEVAEEKKADVAEAPVDLEVDQEVAPTTEMAPEKMMAVPSSSNKASASTATKKGTSETIALSMTVAAKVEEEEVPTDVETTTETTVLEEETDIAEITLLDSPEADLPVVPAPLIMKVETEREGPVRSKATTIASKKTEEGTIALHRDQDRPKGNATLKPLIGNECDNFDATFESSGMNDNDNDFEERLIA